MATLFSYELKKLLSRKLTWLMLAICMGILANFDSSMVGLGSMSDYVRGMRDVYAKYEGKVLTDTLAKEASAEYDNFVATHEDEFETYDDGDAHELVPKGIGYCYGAYRAYMDIAHGTTREYYLEAAVRYQGYLDAGCYENGQLLAQDDRLELKREIAMFNNQPPIVHYAEGWRLLDLCNQMMGVFPLFLIALCLAPLFSGERAAKMEGVLLCAAKRRLSVVAKLLAAMAQTLIIFAALYGMQLLVLMLTYGLDGAMASAYYCGWLGVTTDRTLLGVFAGEALVALAAMLALAMLAALFSAAFRNTLVALIAYAGLAAAHFVSVNIIRSGVWLLLKGSVWETVSKIIYLLPGNVLNDGNGGFQVNEILADPGYVAAGLLLSLAVAAAAAVFTQAVYLKRRKT
jgi:ABC-type transport system involved in multi-copper enzyme maturation permease subunit